MRLAFLALGAIALTGCGYVGDPLPPALNIPVPVNDLRVIQRGEKLLIDFTAPALTTEAIGITTFASAEIRIGDAVLPLPLPEPGEAAHAELPARQFVGKEVLARVVLAGPKGRQSSESNLVTLRVTEPLSTPVDLRAEPHPEGVRVSWKPGDNRPVRYRVTRVPEAVADTPKPEYIDKAVELGKEYKYSVVAVTDTGESLPSEPVTIIPRDIFAPAAPVNLNAIAGVNTVELAWDRNAERDLKNYRVYRDDQVLVDGIDVPTFSDRQVTSGQRYRYAVTAIDQAGNEGAKSTEAVIVAP
jgi:hypothetical protein